MHSSTPSYSWNWSSIFQSGEQRCNLLVSISWHSGVAPCMHGALSTQKLELHAIQLWGCTAQNKELSGFCFEQVAPGPAVFGETQIRYLQAKKQWAQANYSVLFCSIYYKAVQVTSLGTAFIWVFGLEKPLTDNAYSLGSGLSSPSISTEWGCQGNICLRCLN